MEDIQAMGLVMAMVIITDITTMDMDTITMGITDITTDIIMDIIGTVIGNNIEKMECNGGVSPSLHHLPCFLPDLFWSMMDIHEDLFTRGAEK
ncbi:MAG TPA: hypothetical protein VIG80_03045 [Bacillaceae bacterium]